MASAELLTSPPPPQSEPVIVVDSSDDEQEGEPNSKRRRTICDTESTENVIDLTEVDERATSDDHFRFKIIPKLIRLPSFQFTENDDDESDGIPLESFRAHLSRIFGSGVFGVADVEEEAPQEPPSPIDPDELEITGVKESTNPSTTTTTTTVTATATPTSTTATTKRAAPLPPPTSTKEKEKDKGVTLECAICLGDMKKITATTCGHVFCHECIRTAIQVTKCCPMCKKKLTLRSIHPLYL